MLVYATPSYSDYFYSSTPGVLYPLSHLTPAPARAPTARETYLRAVAEAQSARQKYLRELEERRLLESLRQQEALRREEEIRRQEALHLIALRQQHARHILARHRAEPVLCRHSFLPAGAIAPRIVQRQYVPALSNARQDQQLFGAIFGLNAELEGEKGPDEALAEHARKLALDARARFLSKLDVIQEKAHAVRNSCAQRTDPTSTGPVDGPERSAKVPTQFLPVVLLRRRPEMPRGRERRDRAARTIQRRWRSHSASVAARRDALRTIDVLRARFHYLRDTFVFPEHLEFRTLESAQEVAPALSYSSSNANVHKYMNELTKLLTHADGVPSEGSNTVRDARRSFVQDVEEQLDIVETRVRKVWETQGGAVSERQEAAPATSPSTMEPAPLVETVVASAPSDLDPPAESGALNASNPADVSKQAHVVDQEQPQSHPNNSNSNETPDATLREDTHEPTVPLLDGAPVTEAPTSAVTFSDSLPFHDADNDTESQALCIDLPDDARPKSLSADRNVEDAFVPDATSPPEAVLVQVSRQSSVTSEEITAKASNDASTVLDDEVEAGSAAEKFDIVYPDSSTPTSVSLEIDDRGHGSPTEQLYAGASGVHSDKSKGGSVDGEFELL